MIRSAIRICCCCTLLTLFAMVSLAQAQSPTELYKQGAVMPGPLIKGHADLEKDCAQCHQGSDYKNIPNKLCGACHKEVARDIATKRGLHGLRPKARKAPCADCHTDHIGREADIIGLERETFNHDETNFVLRGAHAGVDCQSCHGVGEKFRKAETECRACHSVATAVKAKPGVPVNPRQSRLNRTSDPHMGRLPNCTDCHKDTSWFALVPFDHGRITGSLLRMRGVKRDGFVLVGKHKTAACTTCHAGEQYRNLSTTCFSCHQEQDKLQHKGMFGTKCSICHGQSDWKPKFEAGGGGVNDGSLASAIRLLDRAKFDHSKTKFPLVGNHKTKAKCKDCHIKSFKDTPRNCFACHERRDIHKGLLGKTCESCHSPLGFNKLLAPRNGLSPLTNAIQILDRAKFDHDKTKFKLIGNHKTKAKCKDCHTTGFRKTPKNCFACHERKDKHKGRFGKACESCHSPVGWKSFGGVTLTSGSLREAIKALKRVKFKHNSQGINVRRERRRGQLRGKLRGRHRRAACKDCHKKTFVGTPRDCYSCHAREGRNEHGRARAAGRYRNCGRCHGYGGW